VSDYNSGNKLNGDVPKQEDSVDAKNNVKTESNIIGNISDMVHKMLPQEILPKEELTVPDPKHCSTSSSSPTLSVPSNILQPQITSSSPVHHQSPQPAQNYQQPSPIPVQQSHLIPYICIYPAETAETYVTQTLSFRPLFVPPLAVGDSSCTNSSSSYVQNVNPKNSSPLTTLDTCYPKSLVSQTNLVCPSKDSDMLLSKSVCSTSQTSDSKSKTESFHAASSHEFPNPVEFWKETNRKNLERSIINKKHGYKTINSVLWKVGIINISHRYKGYKFDKYAYPSFNKRKVSTLEQKIHAIDLNCDNWRFDGQFSNKTNNRIPPRNKVTSIEEYELPEDIKKLTLEIVNNSLLTSVKAPKKRRRRKKNNARTETAKISPTIIEKELRIKEENEIKLREEEQRQLQVSKIKNKRKLQTKQQPMNRGQHKPRRRHHNRPPLEYDEKAIQKRAAMKEFYEKRQEQWKIKEEKRRIKKAEKKERKKQKQEKEKEKDERKEIAAKKPNFLEIIKGKIDELPEIGDLTDSLLLTVNIVKNLYKEANDAVLRKNIEYQTKKIEEFLADNNTRRKKEEIMKDFLLCSTEVQNNIINDMKTKIYMCNLLINRFYKKKSWLLAAHPKLGTILQLIGKKHLKSKFEKKTASVSEELKFLNLVSSFLLSISLYSGLEEVELIQLEKIIAQLVFWYGTYLGQVAFLDQLQKADIENKLSAVTNLKKTPERLVTLSDAFNYLVLLDTRSAAAMCYVELFSYRHKNEKDNEQKLRSLSADVIILHPMLIDLLGLKKFFNPAREIFAKNKIIPHDQFISFYNLILDKSKPMAPTEEMGKKIKTMLQNNKQKKSSKASNDLDDILERAEESICALRDRVCGSILLISECCKIGKIKFFNNSSIVATLNSIVSILKQIMANEFCLDFRKNFSVTIENLICRLGSMSTGKLEHKKN
jgi:hypothetical protein